MSQISDIRNPWRNLLSTPASFRGVIFHVENGSRASGRRTVVHEYPKRNEPYAEDMGRHARRFSFSGYLIYRVNPAQGMAPYHIQRTRLLKELEEDDAGKLVHPVFCPGGMLVMCERYSMSESRERGGYTQFDMQFVDATGKAGNSQPTVNTAANTQTKANNAETAAVFNVVRTFTDSGFRPLMPSIPFVPTVAETLVMNAITYAIGANTPEAAVLQSIRNNGGLVNARH